MPAESAQRMKILHLITELELGGAERLLTTMLPRFDRARFDVSVAYLYGDAPLRAELEKNGVRVIKLDTKGKLDVAGFSRLAQLLRDERIDILHTHLIQADLLGFFAARRAGVPVIVSTKHNTHYFRSHGMWLPKLDAFVNRRLSRIIAVSEAVKQFYVQTQKLGADHIEVIHNGIDLDQFCDASPIAKSELGVDDSDLLVCSVGSLTQKKGHSVLLQAWPDISKACPRARLLLVGDGPLRSELEQRAHALGSGERVRFLGRRQDVPSILATADLFVLPSLWEGFGIAVVEAMAAGVAVVASDVDGVREIVRHERDGLLVPSGEPGKLADAVVSLLGAPNRAKALSEEGRRRADEFSIQQTVERLQKLYERLAGS